jgi:glycosyltransferase involved in cell wall biosynthesis
MVDAQRAPLILYVNPDAGIYGSGVCLLELTSHLPPERYRALVALPTEGPLAYALRARGVPVVILPLGGLRRTFRPDQVAGIMWGNVTGRRGLVRLVRERSVAAIHTNNTHVLSGAFAAGRAQVPHITHVRENILPPRLVSTGIASLLFRLSDRLIVVSRGAAVEFLGERASHSKVRVIHDGIDISAFRGDAQPREARSSLGWEMEPLHVGVVARLTPWKGHEVFLRAALRIVTARPGVRFVIVGDADTPRNESYKRRLHALCRDLGLDDSVQWVGFMDPVQPAIAALDVIVVPSVRPEPFGLGVVEAMAMGRPVVAANHGGPPEILSRGGGVLVAPRDPEALAAAVTGLLDDPEERLRMAATGRKEAQARFDIESHVSAVVDVYDELLHSSGSPGAGPWTSQ